MRRIDIVNEARKWVGTPYHHNARVLGHGIDCYGVVEMVGRAMGVPIPEGIKYSRIPDESELLAYMDTYAVRVPLGEAWHGDIIILPFQHKMRHMAIMSDKGMIHAYEPEGCVVEHCIDTKWRRLFKRAYQYPGVTD